MLTHRDWTVDTISCGIKSEDLIAEKDGKRYSVEVKNHALINLKDFIEQARDQATVRKLPWMLAVRLPGYAETWLVMSKDEKPVVWHGASTVSAMCGEI